MTLEVRDLACRRGERLVFSGVGFALGPGGALCVGGRNGSGKSSLLRCLSGLLPPLRGTIAWAGAPIAEDPAAHRARLLLIGHQTALKPVLTARENLAFWAALYGRAEPALIAAALDAFGLAHLAAIPAQFLSAGERRRLALARLLAAPAVLWLLDEPATGLDAAATARLEAVIAEHRARDGLVVATTHTPLALPGAAGLDMDRHARAAA